MANDNHVCQTNDLLDKHGNYMGLYGVMMFRLNHLLGFA